VTRVLLCDDEALIRDGIKAIVQTEPDLDVVAEAANGAEAVELARSSLVDVVLMDIRMPGMDGLEATRRIMDSGLGIKVIVLTTFDMDQYVYEAIASGASGFLLKGTRAAELIAAIRAVVAADTLLAPAVTRRLIETYCRPHPAGGPSLEGLTDRERQVLMHIGLGRSNAEIAADLVIAETTVKTHVSRVLMKLGLRDRAQAVVTAYQSGLLTGPGHGPK